MKLTICAGPATTGKTCTDALDMAVRSAARPPAPLGSLVLNTMTQGRDD